MQANERLQLPSLNFAPLPLSYLGDDLALTPKSEYLERLEKISILPVAFNNGSGLSLPSNIGLDTQHAVGIQPDVELMPILGELDNAAVAICGFSFGAPRTLNIQQFQTFQFPPEARRGKYSQERNLGFYDYKKAFILYLEQFAFWLEDSMPGTIDYISIRLEDHRHTRRVIQLAREMGISQRDADFIVLSKRADELRSMGYEVPIEVIVHDLYLHSNDSMAKPVCEVNPTRDVQRCFRFCQR